MKNLLFQQPNGRIAVMALVVEPPDFDLVGAEVVARGKFPVYCGAFSAGELPANVDVLRFSAGALVVKLDVAADRQWKILKREAQKKLDATSEAALQALEEGSANPSLAAYRSDLRAILTAKPVELTAAKDLAEIDAARPLVLDRPIPR